VAGTLVATPGGLRAIETLEVGERVYSYDHDTKKRCVRTVEAIHRDVVRTVCKVRAGACVIRGVTPGHPFFDVAREAYFALNSLVKDSTLLPFESELGVGIDEVTIEESFAPQFEVFNLTVAGPEHNYFADGVLVHNKDIVKGGWNWSVCGDGVVEEPEQCDDGNHDDTDGCDSRCELARCGDGIVQVGEDCDDANLINDDACSNLCKDPSGGAGGAGGSGGVGGAGGSGGA
jgi:cysteine-rich repeat protein